MDPPLSAASEAMLAELGAPPLPALLGPLLAWFHGRHLELMAQRGFDDVRRAHNQVFIHLPGDGLRLTELAMAADVSKQAMGELVDDLAAKGYLRRVPDPDDGRAKLVVWADRGLRAHEATREVFDEIEAELADEMGSSAMEVLRDSLLSAIDGILSRNPAPE